MKLLKEEIVTMKILRQQGESNEAIAQRLGITEGAIRYHFRRIALQAMDGRFKPSLIEQQGLIEVVDHWWQARLAELAHDRSPNAKALWEFLCDEYRYSGSYKSVQKYVANRYPKPGAGKSRRVQLAGNFEATITLGNGVG